MFVEILICVLVLVIYSFIRHRNGKFKLREQMGIAGPKTNFFLGNLSDLKEAAIKYPDHPMKILKDWRQQYGNVFGYYFGPNLVVNLHDVDLAKEVLIKQFDCFVDRLMSSIINEKIDTFLNSMDSFSKSENTFDIYESFQGLTLDVIGQCAFALSVHCQTDKNDPFLKHVQRFFSLADPLKSPLMTLAFIFPELDNFFVLFRPLQALAKEEQWLLDGLQKVVDERRKSFKENMSVDYLQILLEQQQEADKADNGKYKCTDNTVIMNAFLFLLAGYETTSTALGFTAWLLAKNQDVQEKLRREIDDKVSASDVVNYDLVHKLPYLDAVFHESLRYFPPVPQFITRTCVKECYVGPYHFMPGVQVNIPSKEIHEDPDIWPEPEKFDPNRITIKSEPSCIITYPVYGTSRGRLLAKMTFLPFDPGSSWTTRPYVFCIADSKDPLKTMENGLLFRPKNGVQIRVVKRS